MARFFAIIYDEAYHLGLVTGNNRIDNSVYSIRSIQGKTYTVFDRAYGYY